MKGLGWLSSECVKAREIRLRRQTEGMINFSSLHTVSTLSYFVFPCKYSAALARPWCWVVKKEGMRAGSEQGAGSQGAGRRGKAFPSDPVLEFIGRNAVSVQNAIPSNSFHNCYGTRGAGGGEG